METAEPVSFEFPEPHPHPMASVGGPCRVLGSNLAHEFSFYTTNPNPTVTATDVSSFSLSPLHTSSCLQSSSTTAYSIGHIINGYHPSQLHQRFFPPFPQHQHLNSPPAEPSPLHNPLPVIPPAKKAFCRVVTDLSSSFNTDNGSEVELSSPQSSCCGGGFHQGESQDNRSEMEFSTEVDVLMRAIQSKIDDSQFRDHPVLPPLEHSTTNGNGITHAASLSSSSSPYSVSQPPPSLCSLSSLGQTTASGKKRKYHCTLPHCAKSFAQKTHLDIHIRAHTGDKPFICKESSCGQRFSQLGNLKTHQRRHTGEKPYSCDICHKTFVQRGNVRAHKITHQQSKPFTCLLDDCGKQFTQLGNLKSHQNKFHAATLRHLTLKFASLSEADFINHQDRELWEYFAALYKNSNKGIKGRGKDRKISTTTTMARFNSLVPN